MIKLFKTPWDFIFIYSQMLQINVFQEVLVIVVWNDSSKLNLSFFSRLCHSYLLLFLQIYGIQKQKPMDEMQKSLRLHIKADHQCY